MWARRLISASDACLVHSRPCTALHLLCESVGHCSTAVVERSNKFWTACRGLCSSPDPSSEEHAQASTSSRLPQPRQAQPTRRRWKNNAEICLNPPKRLPNGAQPPWTPTSQLTKRKVYPKRMRHMLSLLKDEHWSELAESRTSFPELGPGYVITVHMVCPVLCHSSEL
jgi:hypothetical protein